MKQVRSIIFVFLVLTIVSSLLSSVAFVTGNNLAFASSKKKNDSSGRGDKEGSSEGSNDNGGGGGGSSDTGSTSTPPPITEETTPPPATATEQTCPDGSKPDPATGNCPTPPDNNQETATTPPPATGETTPAPTLAMRQGSVLQGGPIQGSGPIQATQPTPLGDGSYQLPTVPAVPNTNTIAPICPSGSHLELNKCVIDGATCPSGTVQDGDKCTPQSNPPATTPTNTPPAQPPTTPTGQKLAPLQTLSPQQTCKDGSTPDANGKCQDGSTPVETPSQQTTRCAEGTLPTNIPGYCYPLGTPGPSQIEVPANPDGSCPEESYRVGSAGNAGQPGTGSEFCVKNVHVFVNSTKLLPGSSTADCTRDTIVFAGKCIPATTPMTTSTTSGVCPDGSTPDANGNCLTCPSNTQLFGGKCVGQLPVIPGSSTGSGGGFIQMFPVKPDGSIGTSGPVVVYVPVNKDGTCPPGDEPASGGYCRHKIQSTPPPTPPTNTPPVQPQPPQQFAPSQPECVPGFHWDNAQLKCVAG